MMMKVLLLTAPIAEFHGENAKQMGHIAMVGLMTVEPGRAGENIIVLMNALREDISGIWYHGGIVSLTW